MTPTLTPAVSAHDHAQGSADAPVTLVEYGDFQCSYCGQAYSIVKQVQQEMGDQMRFVFRNFPLPDIHPNALAAADFAEEAAQQNQFWLAHDWLFEHQDSLDADGLDRAARSLDLDASTLKRGHAAAHARVAADLDGGGQNRVQGTPTFFINGESFDGSWDYSALLAAVQDAAKSGAALHNVQRNL